MAQAPFHQWERLTHHLQDYSIALLQQLLQQRQGRRLLVHLERVWADWKERLGGAAIGGLLLLWHWQLVVSIAVGVSTCVGVYLAQQNRLRLPLPQWQRRGRKLWQQAWSLANRSLTVAIATGILTLSLTYFSIALWQELHQSWLAIALMLQSLGLLSVVLLLLWRTFSAGSQDFAAALETEAIERWLSDLTAADPLTRLIAVQQLVVCYQAIARFSNRASHDAKLMSAQQLAECLRLMLNRETEAIVCRALLDGLRVLDGDRGQGERSDRHRQLPASSAPVMMDAIEVDTKTGVEA